MAELNFNSNSYISSSVLPSVLAIGPGSTAGAYKIARRGGDLFAASVQRRTCFCRHHNSSLLKPWHDSTFVALQMAPRRINTHRVIPQTIPREFTLPAWEHCGIRAEHAPVLLVCFASAQLAVAAFVVVRDLYQERCPLEPDMWDVIHINCETRPHRKYRVRLGRHFGILVSHSPCESF